MGGNGTENGESNQTPQGSAGLVDKGPTAEAADPEVTMPHTRAFSPNEFNANGFFAQSGWGTGFYGVWHQALFTPIKAWTYFDDEVPLIGAKRVETKEGGCVKEVELIDGLQWWDGTEFTAEHVGIKYKLQSYQTYGPDPFEETEKTFEVVDDSTYRWRYNAPLNNHQIRHARRDKPYLHPGWYNEWLEKYGDATTRDEVDRITEDLSNASISMEKFVEDGLGNGLWKPSEWDQISMTWERWDGHPLSDVTNLTTWNWEMVPDQTKRQQRYQRGDFDAVHFSDQGKVSPEEAQNIELVTETEFNSTLNIHFNFGDTHFRNRDVRRAVAYLIDFEELASALQRNGIPATPPIAQTGLSDKPSKQWLGEDWLPKTIDYGTTAQPEKAREAMRAAGYSQSGDVWVSDDGEETKGLKFITQKGSTKLELIGQYASSTMSDFGIKCDLTFLSFGEFDRQYQRGEPAVLGHWAWSGPAAGFPPRAYVTRSGRASMDHYFGAVPNDFTKPSTDDCERIDIESVEIPYEEETGAYLSMPVHDEFPQDVGATELGGNPQQLQPIKWRWKAEQANDTATIREISRRFAQYYNFALPRIELYNELAQMKGNTREYAWQSDTPLGSVTRIAPWIAWGGIYGLAEKE
jgi:peptide/nickel transport system substrate-binding protein